MNCGEARDLLVDLLYEELDADNRASVAAHLEACPDCRLDWRRLQALATAADRWSAPPAPRGIAERALIRVHAEERGAPAPVSLPTVLVWRLLAGGAAALVSLMLVAGITNRAATSVRLALIGVVWTILYSGVLLAGSHPRLRGLARAAVAAAGVALVLAPLMTIPRVVEVCASWMRSGQHSAPLALVLIVVAAGYTAAPLLVGVLAARREQQRGWLVDGLKLSGLYALLIAPAVYLECVALPLEVTALWMTGALLGTAAGGPIGLRVGEWLRSAALK